MKGVFNIQEKQKNCAPSRHYILSYVVCDTITKKMYFLCEFNMISVNNFFIV